MAQPLSDTGTKESRRPPRRADPRKEDRDLVEALLQRDEEACEGLLQKHYGAMVHIARGYVGRHAIAEEVVQEAWMAMFRGLERFDGRSSVKTWLFSIVIQRARTVGARERRTESVSQLVAEWGDDSYDPTERFFHGNGHPDVGSWAMPPLRWRHSPEAKVLDAEMRSWILQAIEDLPEMQCVVMNLRDVEGWDTAEIAQLLGRTRNWVRVMLHRARFKVRAVIERKQGVQE